VKIIGLDRIAEAEEEHSEWGASLRSWKKILEGSSWKNFPDVRRTRKDADPVGSCVVFDIAHNRARLILRILYGVQTVVVLSVISHAEYDKERWKDACSCY
jgi:mRNA interferase HigB